MYLSPTPPEVPDFEAIESVGPTLGERSLRDGVNAEIHIGCSPRSRWAQSLLVRFGVQRRAVHWGKGVLSRIDSPTETPELTKNERLWLKGKSVIAMSRMNRYRRLLL
jgi:hypothetical protein